MATLPLPVRFTPLLKSTEHLVMNFSACFILSYVVHEMRHESETRFSEREFLVARVKPGFHYPS